MLKADIRHGSQFQLCFPVLRRYLLARAELQKLRSQGKFVGGRGGRGRGGRGGRGRGSMRVAEQFEAAARAGQLADSESAALQV